MKTLSLLLALITLSACGTPQGTKAVATLQKGLTQYCLTPEAVRGEVRAAVNKGPHKACVQCAGDTSHTCTDTPTNGGTAL